MERWMCGSVSESFGFLVFDRDETDAIIVTDMRETYPAEVWSNY
jgi:hypothetical protein